MTIEEVKRSEAVYLTPAEAAPILGCDPQALRLAARDDPQRLPFPVIRLGSRTKIPRVPFLRALGYEEGTA